LVENPGKQELNLNGAVFMVGGFDVESKYGIDVGTEL
jgi:hypothetical protein